MEEYFVLPFYLICHSVSFEIFCSCITSQEQAGPLDLGCPFPTAENCCIQYGIAAGISENCCHFNRLLLIILFNLVYRNIFLISFCSCLIILSVCLIHSIACWCNSITGFFLEGVECTLLGCLSLFWIYVL